MCRVPAWHWPADWWPTPGASITRRARQSRYRRHSVHRGIRRASCGAPQYRFQDLRPASASGSPDPLASRLADAAARREPAGPEIVDHPVAQAIEFIALLQHGLGDPLQLRIGKGFVQQGLALRIARRDAIDGLQAEHLIGRNARKVERGVARRRPIELHRQALRDHHGLATTGGAAHEI